ncbi:MAG: DUF362 domain-containing protein [Candidatus Heimdallarchaeaceae archaeon]
MNHPEGFDGEIVIADNGQGRGSMDWDQTNSEDKKQSVQDIVDFFSKNNKISVFLWDNIGWNKVQEYSAGDNESGYIVYDTADEETGIYTSYPKFETIYGTKISFKYGIWNETAYEKRLKIINFPVLKSHSGYGVTAAMKNYMWVQTQKLANGHEKVATGGMGTLMAECGLPTLNILDAIWVNANPSPSVNVGPSTTYSEATRVNVILASLDPIALDYWAAKHILVQTAELLGKKNIETINPDEKGTKGLTEAFGIWLEKSKDELIRGGSNVTSNEAEMNIFANSLTINTTFSPNSYLWIYLTVGSFTVLLVIVILFILKKKGKILFRSQRKIT